MSVAFARCEQLVRTNYAAQTGADPAALPPGTLGGIIAILLPILMKLLGSCGGTTTPPTTGAKALIEHCQQGSVFAHYQIRRQIRLNGGLDRGMGMRETVNTILLTGAQATPEEVQALYDENQEG
jgi:hypothetical protein